MSYYPQKNTGWGAPVAGVNIRRTGKSNGQNWVPIIEGGYLMHFGIKGQKWGIRRYQNEDGSLTEEGKKRYNEGAESAEWKRSEAKRLSDDELRRRNARLQAEQQYKNLTTTDSERERQQFKKDLLKKALIIPVVAVAGVVGKKLISSHADQIANLFSKYGKRGIAQLRTKFSLKNVVSKGAKPYTTGVGTEIQNNPDMFNRGFDAWKDIRKYNYRPRINNAMPKSRPWPKL